MKNIYTKIIGNFKSPLQWFTYSRVASYVFILVLIFVTSPLSVFAQYDNELKPINARYKPNDIEKILQLADSLKKENNLDSAAAMYISAEYKSIYLNYFAGRIKALIGKSEIEKEKYNYEKANAILNEAILYCNKSNNTLSFTSLIYSEIGANLAYRGIFEEAALNFEKAIKAAELSPHETLPIETIYTSLVGVYTNAGMYDKAYLYIDKIKEKINQKPNKQLDVYRLWLLASLSNLQNQNDKALLFIDSLIPLALSINDHPSLFTAYWKAGDINIVKGDLKNAKHYLNLLHTVSDKVEPILKIREHRLAAQVARLAKDYHLSIKEYQIVLAYAKQFGSLYDKYSTHSGMAKTYAAMNDFKSAYEQEQLVKIYKDSLRIEEQTRSIAAVEARYQDAKKDKAIAEKDKDLAQKGYEILQKNTAINNRNILIVASILFLIIILLVFFFVFKNYKQKQLFKEEAMRLALKEKELGATRLMMDAEEQERTRIARDIHDGLMIKFSTVTMNLSTLFDGDKEKEPYLEQLDKAIASLRNVAHNLMPDILLDGGLSEALFYFCENINDETNVDFVFNLVNEIPRFDEKFEIAVYRMVQELIQNIIKHANATEAYIQMSFNDGILNVTVEDNGIGITQDHKKSTGLGLKSIYNRMLTLGGNIDIASDAASGTSIMLEFVIEHSGNEAKA